MTLFNLRFYAVVIDRTAEGGRHFGVEHVDVVVDALRKLVEFPIEL